MAPAAAASPCSTVRLDELYGGYFSYAFAIHKAAPKFAFGSAGLSERSFLLNALPSVRSKLTSAEQREPTTARNLLQ